MHEDVLQCTCPSLIRNVCGCWNKSTSCSTEPKNPVCLLNVRDKQVRKATRSSDFLLPAISHAPELHAARSIPTLPLEQVKRARIKMSVPCLRSYSPPPKSQNSSKRVRSQRIRVVFIIP